MQGLKINLPKLLANRDVLVKSAMGDNLRGRKKMKKRNYNFMTGM